MLLVAVNAEHWVRETHDPMASAPIAQRRAPIRYQLIPSCDRIFRNVVDWLKASLRNLQVVIHTSSGLQPTSGCFTYSRTGYNDPYKVTMDGDRPLIAHVIDISWSSMNRVRTVQRFIETGGILCTMGKMFSVHPV